VPSCKERKNIEEGDRELNTTCERIEEVDELLSGKYTGLRAWIRKTSESKGSSGVEKWREMASLITNRSIPLKIRGNVYESCVRSVMLYGAETWALTRKLKDILKSCDAEC